MSLLPEKVDIGQIKARNVRLVTAFRPVSLVHNVVPRTRSRQFFHPTFFNRHPDLCAPGGHGALCPCRKPGVPLPRSGKW